MKDETNSPKNMDRPGDFQRTWQRVIDYEVQDETGSKIGSVHNLWAEDDGQPIFLGVKTGWVGNNHVVPVHTASVNHMQRIVRLPFSKEKIKGAPTFDADHDLSDADDASIYRYYGLERRQPQMAQGKMEQQQRQPREAGAGKEGANIQLSEEQLKVGKREAVVGGVRLRKVVRTETVNQPVELQHEEVVIERVPASGVQQAGAASFKEDDVFIPLRREEAIVQKEARVREEVRVRKEATSEQQTISGQVRKEDVEVQKEGEARFASDTGKPRSGTPRYQPKERSKP